MKSKILMSIVFVNLIFLVSILSLKSNENTINNSSDTTIIIDSNVLVFWNRIIHEWFNDNDLSAMNLLTGTVVNEHDQNKDIQLRDSSGTRNNFYLRSGDISLRIPGFETKFGMYIAYDNITASEFDTLSKIINLGSALEPSDFTKVSTAEYTNPTYFNAPLVQNTVYSFYLKGKHDASITPNPVYGMLRLRSAFMQGGGFRIAVDVKINTAGENQFRDSTVNIKKSSTNIPIKFKLYNNYPNPFNPETTIGFDIPKSTFTQLIIFDALGREIAILLNEKLSAGSYEVDWNGKDYPSGVYFYKLVSGDFVDVKKMMLVK